MLRLLTPEPLPADTAVPASEEPQEFEIVLGRRQAASLCFLACVLLVIGCGVSYLAGRASAETKRPTEPVAPAPTTQSQTPQASQDKVQDQVQTSQDAAQPQPAATVAQITTQPEPAKREGVNEPVTTQPAEGVDQGSVFTEPAPGALYIQIGAV